MVALAFHCACLTAPMQYGDPVRGEEIVREYIEVERRAHAEEQSDRQQWSVSPMQVTMRMYDLLTHRCRSPAGRFLCARSHNPRQPSLPNSHCRLSHLDSPVRRGHGQASKRRSLKRDNGVAHNEPPTSDETVPGSSAVPPQAAPRDVFTCPQSKGQGVPPV